MPEAALSVSTPTLVAAIMLRSQGRVRNIYIEHLFLQASTMETPCSPLQEEILKVPGGKKKIKGLIDPNEKKNKDIKQ